MNLTRDDLVKKLRDYLQRRLSLKELIDWAERMMMDADFEGLDAEKLKEVTARLGLADAKNFELTWEDCLEMLQKLGHSARVDVVPVEPVLRVADDHEPYGKKESS